MSTTTPISDKSESADAENDNGVNLTRRQLLGAAALAGAGLAAGPMMGLPGSQAHAQAAPAPSQPRPISPDVPGAVPVTLKINGQTYDLKLEPRVTLLDALREYIGLTGTKMGCDHGQCGACTVLVNGRRVNSCLSLAIAYQDEEITTVEGLAKGDELHPIQQAFIDQDAFQCGYCTPGQLCSAVGLMNEGHAHTDDDIRELMSGNICRCGAYNNIVNAVKQAMGQTVEHPAGQLESRS